MAGDRLTGTGSFIYNNGVGNPSLWVNNQADYSGHPHSCSTATASSSQSSRISGGGLAGNGRLSGTTAANAYALTDASGGRVETTVNANFGKLALMPTTYIGNGDGTVLILQRLPCRPQL